MKYNLTEVYLSQFKIKTIHGKECELNTNQHTIVSTMANRDNVLISGLQQSGMTIGVIIGIQYLKKILGKKVLYIVRNSSALAHVRSLATDIITGPECIELTDIVIDGHQSNVEDYDTIVVDDCLYSNDKQYYLDLGKEDNDDVNVILVSSHGAHSAIDPLTSLDGTFDVVALKVADRKKLSILDSLS